MRGSVGLGRAGPIPIRLHVSWVLVFGLVSWSLAQGYFPIELPGQTVATYWVVGAVSAILLFASVLIHELGHSWVAIRHGLPIQSITLFVFGGIARIGREPSDPRVEFRIAVAGPLTSLLLAALFAGVRWVTAGVPLLAVPAAWLARVNLILALFNTLPGFPLDGGRVLRAVLWKRTGSFERATRVASATGEVLAFGFIALAVVMMLGGNVIGGLWMALIGWFLQNAAVSSYAQSNVRELLRGVTVAQAMIRDCPRVTADVHLDRLVQEEVLGHGRRCFLVADDGQLRGLLTLHEVKAVPRERWAEMTVGQVMTAAERLATVGPQEDLLAALEKMDRANVAQVPVVSDGELLGMLGREQVLHYIRVRSELGQ